MASRSARTRIILNVTSFILHILLNLIFYVLVILFITRFSSIAYHFAYQLYGNVVAEESPGRDVFVTIKKGESTMSLAEKLEQKKVIVNKYSFFVRAKFSLTNKQPILPGKYQLNTSMNYQQILTIITDPSSNLEKKKQKEK